MCCRRVAATVFLVVLLGAAIQVSASDQTKPADISEQFFRDPRIPCFRIVLDEADLQEMRKDDRKYVRATVEVDKIVFHDVGFHVKGGAGSYRRFDDKPALTLNFDRFVQGQLFRGIDKLHLNNSVQDPSYLTEIVCGDMFRAVGVPAARGTHAIVELQKRNRGLYVLNEGFDKTFLRHWFKNVSGNLYDGGFLIDIDAKIKKVSGAERTPDYEDLKTLAAACRDNDLAQRAEKLQKLLDVDRFITLVALEVMTWHWDGYGMKANNYRVYHDPSTGKITFFPHGMDQMFSDVNGSIDPPAGGLVARRMFQMPEFRKRYYDRLAELRRTVFLPDKLDQRVDELIARLKPELDSIDRNLARSVVENAKNLKVRMRQRAEAIDKQLAARATKP